MIIAVDAAGGDYAPREVVEGALKAAKEYGVEIALVGNRAILHVIAGRELSKSGVTIVDATQVIDFHDHPMEGVRSKPDSSIVVGINLVRDGHADAFVSAGNTGAVLVAALLNLGRIEGVERPALGSFIDITPTMPLFLIDAGANADCRPGHLLQFGQLGSLYYRKLLNVDSPSVALLSNGGEETKGNHLVQESHVLLKQSELNFIGNIEGQDIPRGVAHVLVTDGFTGNIVLKTIEGLGDSFQTVVRQAGHVVSAVSHLQGRDLLSDIGLGSWVKRVDYREYGGACLLGVNGNVIVAHGRSKAKAITKAIGLAKKTADQEICRLIREESYVQTNRDR
jgi:glycerol-3-phosphate acyltransferase PlsX